jgi:hypothetical protein
MPPLPPRKDPRRKPGQADKKKKKAGYVGKHKKPDPNQNGKKP